MNSTMQNKQNSVEFTSLDTKAIKGIALILMLFHHLAAFPGRYPGDFAGFYLERYVQEFAAASMISAPFFCFLGGYGMFLRWKSGKLSITANIFNLYKSYWKVFLIYIPIGILFFSRGTQTAAEFYNLYSFETVSSMLTAVISDFLGLTCELNLEWWFLKFYVCTTLMGLIFCQIIRKSRNFWGDLMLLLAWHVFTGSVLPGLTAIPVFSGLKADFLYMAFFRRTDFSNAFLMGIVFAKYDGVRRIKQMLLESPCSSVVCVGFLGILAWSRTYILGGEADLVYCGVLVPLISVLLDRMVPVKKSLVYLAKHSTNIWFIHSFYCYYYPEVARVVYGTRNVVADLLILIVMSLVSSIILEWFYAHLGSVLNWLQKKRRSGKEETLCS